MIMDKEEKGCCPLTPEEIKKRLQRKKVVDTVIKIAQDRGTRDQKICEIRDYLLYAITGFYWDEVESNTVEE